MDIKYNTVSAFNQMNAAPDTSFIGDPNAKRRILIVGNSITRHGIRPEIGWNNDWGMAASALEKDFVHRLYTMLKENGEDVFFRIRQCSVWETGFLDKEILSQYEEEHNFDADTVIFRLGENVPKGNVQYFKDAMREFMEYICPNKGRAVYTTCFWRKVVVDEAIQEIAKERGEICIDGCFSDDESNMALGQFEHGGVAKHPSDKGMEVTAKALFDLVKR